MKNLGWLAICVMVFSGARGLATPGPLTPEYCGNPSASTQICLMKSGRGISFIRKRNYGPKIVDRFYAIAKKETLQSADSCADIFTYYYGVSAECDVQDNCTQEDILFTFEEPNVKTDACKDDPPQGKVGVEDAFDMTKLN